MPGLELGPAPRSPHLPPPMHTARTYTPAPHIGGLGVRLALTREGSARSPFPRAGSLHTAPHSAPPFCSVCAGPSPAGEPPLRSPPHPEGVTCAGSCFQCA